MDMLTHKRFGSRTLDHDLTEALKVECERMAQVLASVSALAFEASRRMARAHGFPAETVLVLDAFSFCAGDGHMVMAGWLVSEDRAVCLGEVDNPTAGPHLDWCRDIWSLLHSAATHSNGGSAAPFIAAALDTGVFATIHNDRDEDGLRGELADIYTVPAASASPEGLPDEIAAVSDMEALCLTHGVPWPA